MLFIGHMVSPFVWYIKRVRNLYTDTTRFESVAVRLECPVLSGRNVLERKEN